MTTPADASGHPPRPIRSAGPDEPWRAFIAGDGPAPGPIARPLLPPTVRERLDELRHRFTAAVPTVRRSGSLAIGAVLLGVAAWWLLRPPAPPVDASLPVARPQAGGGTGGIGQSAAIGRAGGSRASVAAAGTAATSVPGAAGPVVVYAAGRVVRPGVYRLPGGSRVTDALAAAGGSAPGADLNRLNLAAPLQDGERVYVPAVGEAVPPVVAGEAPPPPSASPSLTTSGAGAAPGAAPGAPVNLNTATAAELDALPGVGPATAQAIIDRRTTGGPFRSVDDLLDVRGIGEAKLAALRDLVVV
ncbi:MAG: helix-hairpin-helix domain-containing protein [Actinobacteria bacterium]|nr:helix-hairpin-helix domain-containing protein [Actinomycetota bacterium]